MQEQMKNKILYTDEARCDLDSIWDYIALDLQNQQAAERLVNKIMDLSLIHISEPTRH